MELTGKRILVTGGASGIGEGAALLFAELGASVVIADINAQAGAALARRLGAGHEFLRLDVADPAQWDGLAGPFDIAFLNAGVLTRPPTVNLFDDPLPWTDAKAFQRLVGVNLGGVLHGALACRRLMQGRPGATILATSSIAGVRYYPLDPLYSMTKYGVIGLMGSLAPGYAKLGIRIITVCPGGVETPLTPPDLRAKRRAEGTFAQPADFARGLMQIYRQAQAGEVWLARSNETPYRWDVPPPVDRPLAKSSSTS